MKKIFLLAIFLFLLTGCSMDDIESELKNENDFSLSEDRGYADKYNISYYIEGVVKNLTSKEYSYVQIEFNTYDNDGNVIGSCLDNINNFDANGTWKIKAICSGEPSKIKSYKLKGFSAW